MRQYSVVPLKSKLNTILIYIYGSYIGFDLMMVCHIISNTFLTCNVLMYCLGYEMHVEATPDKLKFIINLIINSKICVAKSCPSIDSRLWIIQSKHVVCGSYLDYSAASNGSTETKLFSTSTMSKPSLSISRTKLLLFIRCLNTNKTIKRKKTVEKNATHLT